MKWVFAVCLPGLMMMCGDLQAQDELTEARPSPEHKVLEMETGTWDGNIKMWMPGAGEEPVRSTGTEVCHTVGPFWVVTDLDYEAFGRKLGGHGTFGYDPGNGKYRGFWMGVDSPYPLMMTGEFDENTNTMTWAFTGKDPTGNPLSGKVITTFKGDNKKHFQLFMDIGQDKLFKIMEIDYTRKKSATDNR